MERNIKKKQEKFQESKKKIIVLPRGRVFQGVVAKKFPKRVVIEFDRTVYVKKYDRFYRKSTKIHARLSENLENEINLGDLIKVQECRPLSKIVNFIVIEKINPVKEKAK